MISGVRHGSTESSGVCSALLQDLQDRRLNLPQPILESVVGGNLKRANKLKQAVLQKAFSVKHATAYEDDFQAERNMGSLVPSETANGATMGRSTKQGLAQRLFT